MAVAPSTPAKALQHLLVISLGNPSPYSETLHSAGHIALKALQQRFPSDYPPYRPNKDARAGMPVSEGPSIHLRHCPTFINESGPWVRQAFKGTKKLWNPLNVGLVIVHDDLEEALGVVKVRDWNASGRGHNGIKSIKAHMVPFMGHKWARITIGVGRPQGRDHRTVAQYLLDQIQDETKTIIQNAAPEVAARLRGLESKWDALADSPTNSELAGRPRALSGPLAQV